jgi:sialate O-acetylesterase
VGNPADIHPKDKETVGLRLAYNALARDYGQQVEYLGPTLKSSTVDGASMRLTFDHTGGALTMKGDTGRVFALAGADQVWHWAKPEIQGDTIVITAPEVTTPVAARFGWQNSQTGFLYNAAGLPASQFRTDDWPVGK